MHFGFRIEERDLAAWQDQRTSKVLKKEEEIEICNVYLALRLSADHLKTVSET